MYFTRSLSIEKMDGLPEEIVLHIFSFLPVPFVFKSVSIVCKDFRHLAYDQRIVRTASHIIQEVKLGKKGILNLEAVRKLLEVVNMSPSDTLKSLALQNGSRGANDLLCHFLKRCRNLYLLNLSDTNGEITEAIAFVKLRELNVSGTSINNHFLHQLSRACTHLYCLNISRCSNVTEEGISQALFNLTVLNIAECRLGGESVIHAIRDYGCTLVCARGIDITRNVAETIDTLFPDVLEVGIPVICGFSFRRYTCPNICCWCAGNDVTRNLLSVQSCSNLYEV